MGILPALELHLQQAHTDNKVKAIWICTNLLSGNDDSVRERAISKFFTNSSKLIAQKILSELLTGQNRRVKKEGLWFLNNLLSAAHFEVENLQNFLNDQNIMVVFLHGLQSQKEKALLSETAESILMLLERNTDFIETFLSNDGLAVMAGARLG